MDCLLRVFEVFKVIFRKGGRIMLLLLILYFCLLHTRDLLLLILELGVVYVSLKFLLCYRNTYFFSKEIRGPRKTACSVPVFRNAEQQDSGSCKALGLILILH